MTVHSNVRTKKKKTFSLLLLLLQLGDGVDGADVDAVQDVQQDLGQTQQVSEVVEPKVDEVSRQVHHLCRTEGNLIKPNLQNAVFQFL